MTDWTQTPEGCRALSRITPADLHVVYRIETSRLDRFVLAGPIINDLRALRRAAAEKVYGCTFDQACSRKEYHEWLAAYAAQPEPETVLASRFGDPNAMGFHRHHGMTLPDVGWTAKWRAQARPQMERAA